MIKVMGVAGRQQQGGAVESERLVVELCCEQKRIHRRVIFIAYPVAINDQTVVTVEHQCCVIQNAAIVGGCFGL